MLEQVLQRVRLVFFLDTVIFQHFDDSLLSVVTTGKYRIARPSPDSLLVLDRELIATFSAARRGILVFCVGTTRLAGAG